LREYRNFKILKCKKGHFYAVGDYYREGELVGELVFFGYKFPIKAVVKFADKAYTLTFGRGIVDHIISSSASLEGFFKVVMFHVVEVDDYFFSDTPMKLKANICSLNNRECLCEAALFFGRFMAYHKSFWNLPEPPCK